ncbi:hypothetical protein [Acinetobacter baumannii]|uniref:hypothetical protein n=1 Tax=Acinetobacter baumannii TaxID=470 RepID=UPI002446A823|nr:hypothetical protein [Acinetobacter baumannii]MDH2587143.1 hypothetical protein [Acinetobacter baumannii]
MKLELKNFIIKVCDWIFGLTTIFFIAVFIFFKIDGVTTPFKEALSISVSFLSALATLGAAIIAARLFQTWKTQHSYVEQIKILSQMLEIVSEIQKSLEEARKNTELGKIILGLQTHPNFDTLFIEQAAKINTLRDYLHSLFRLENQIYLLNNDKRDRPVFNDIPGEECPVIALLKYTEKLEEDIFEILNLLTFDFAGNSLSYEEFNMEKKEIQNLVLNVINDGGLYLHIINSENFISRENPINTQLSNWLRGLDKRIIKYRDSLDTLN